MFFLGFTTINNKKNATIPKKCRAHGLVLIIFCRSQLIIGLNRPNNSHKYNAEMDSLASKISFHKTGCLPGSYITIGSSCFSWIEEWAGFEERVLYHNEIASMSSPWSEEQIGRRFQWLHPPSPSSFDPLFFEQSMDPVGHELFSAPTWYNGRIGFLVIFVFAFWLLLSFFYTIVLQRSWRSTA